SRIRPTSGWVWRLAATLAVLAQCWIAVAPLSESRGFGLSAHVEALGNHRGHYTHDATTCPACTVLSLHVLSSQPAVVPGAPDHSVFRMIVAPVSWVPTAVVHPSQPRAPPAVV
ncbi:MAG: hypothetical protein ABI311_13855, partial [Gemmatimonadaceae bacterium]